MNYTAINTQTHARTGSSFDLNLVLEWAERLGWEDCETQLIEWGAPDWVQPAEFPCTYSFHYGEEHYTCELTSNRPDGYCEVHAA